VRPVGGRSNGRNRCEEGGLAGEAAGAERRQSHGRVKPRERSFYVPSLFSFFILFSSIEISQYRTSRLFTMFDFYIPGVNTYMSQRGMVMLCS
jgi:hypothetical protein